MLRGLASSCIDVSDGLLADLTHILEASRVGASIHEKRLPISAAAASLLGEESSLRSLLLNGGDDYELCFTINASQKTKLVALAAQLNLDLTCIGEIKNGTGLDFVDSNGAVFKLETAGYNHFS